MTVWVLSPPGKELLFSPPPTSRLFSSLSVGQPDFSMWISNDPLGVVYSEYEGVPFLFLFLDLFFPPLFLFHMMLIVFPWRSVGGICFLSFFFQKLNGDFFPGKAQTLFPFDPPFFFPTIHLGSVGFPFFSAVYRLALSL